MFELPNKPFTTPYRVIIWTMFLNLYVGKVASKILDVFWVIRLMGEPGKATPVKPYGQISIIGTKGINSHIKFLITKKQRVVNILLNNKSLIWLRFFRNIGSLFLFLALILTALIVFIRLNWLLNSFSSIFRLIYCLILVILIRICFYSKRSNLSKFID